MDRKPSSYFYPEHISPELFDLPATPGGQRERALQQVGFYCDHFEKTFMGYQSNNDLDFQHLARYLDVALNNIGDSYANPNPAAPAFADGFFTLNCKWVERAVVDYFADRWGLKTPRLVKEDCPDEDPSCWEESYWGYVLSMGSTEGNLMALRGARDYLKGRRLLHEPGPSEGAGAGTTLGAMGYAEVEEPLPDPVLLYSDHSHYSIKKLAQILEFDAVLVPTDEHGRIDLDALEGIAATYLNKKVPIAVSFNYGTTFTAAFDDVEKAIERLMPHIRANGMHERRIVHRSNGREDPCVRKGYWFHVDGALGAGHVTFARQERNGREVLYRYPQFDFSLDIQSLVVSGHKWPGAPWPTGIYMTRNRYMLTNDVPSYVGSLDSTLAGSRSGIAPLFLWDWIARAPDSEREAKVQNQLEVARHALKHLERWNARRAPGSVAVTFDQPSDRVLRAFSIPVNGKGRAHILCMPHVTEKMVDDLVKAIIRDEPGVLESARTDFGGLDRGGW